jgi:hypothetical protein
VEEHRRGDREAHSLSGIVVEIDLLRQGLEAVAAKVRWSSPTKPDNLYAAS